MPSLEERLFNCIEQNLKHKDDVIQLYGKMFNRTRELSLTKDFSQEFADAMNRYKGKKVLKAGHFSGYSSLHIESNYLPFERKHAIMSFLFGIVLPEKKWKTLLKKLEWEKWACGMFVPAGYFLGDWPRELDYSAFGFTLGSGQGIYAHEAIHANRQLYSSNCCFIDSYGAQINYSDDELRARCEYTFIDEMHAYIIDNWEKESLKKTLKTNYWNAEIKTICSFANNSWPASSLRKRKLKNSVKPVFAGLDRTIEACFYLKQRLEPDILTPLFYSLGPTIAEISRKGFPSIFADICLWAELLEKDIVRQGMIRDELQKKGYCCEDIILA
ncbi:MAG: hypothetical protein PHO02_03045 [Candidatus Nanoarchaeia archaeon]|nr:hypothetical protein [Candidatus Nanoarchaeia archaeon]